jgi:tRNA A-37 threonylcarbamoyl transferase component Bud32
MAKWASLCRRGYNRLMETDPTDLSVSGTKHPTLAELRSPSAPAHISQHLASCSMCRSVVQADGQDGIEPSTPIALDLPKGLVSENAFRWPADPIARGGMAQIFLGEDRRLGRTVILKAPREGDDLPAGMGDLFQRRVTAEARILAKLQHPSIVTIYELGKASVGWPFCVLERVEGTSLRDRLDDLCELEARDGMPRTRERLELLSNLVAIAEALAYAHEQRVVHRDCTPNNIILGKRGEPTLIDWGIARDLDAPGQSEPALDNDPSLSGRMVTISAGTPPYLPLEQSQGRAADPSFDVYSFGITLYEVVAGKAPFDWKHVETQGERGRQLNAFLDWLKSRDPVAPASLRDPELSGIIARAMAHDPAQRFTSDELVRALKQYLTGDLVFSHRYSITGRMARWARRHRAASTAIASLVFFAIAGALVWVQFSRAAREEAELRATAAAAHADAAEKGRAADDATREAEAARALAEDAQKKGQNADELRKQAEQKKRAAERARADANNAATQAKGTADEAVKQFREAMKQKQAAEALRDGAITDKNTALIAQSNAERDRDAARSVATAADRERDTARAAQQSAERVASVAESDRDSARQGQSRAEQERETARNAQANAERDRDQAIAAKREVETERDEARRRLVDLERRVRELERERNQPPPPPSPSP